MSKLITATPKLNKKQTIDFLKRLVSNVSNKEIICLKKSVEEVRNRKCQHNK